MLNGLWHDLRYSGRAMRTSPGFFAVAILSLALGIGANTAIFSLIDAVMLKLLPVSRPQELLQVTMATPQYFTGPRSGADSGAPGRVFRNLRLRTLGI